LAGFGVEHLILASLWHSAPGPKRYGTFVEYTNLVGALGFRTAVEALKAARLVCIDEFELDDPGDTVLMSTLLGELVSSGVSLAATSNTLPDRLGEGRFAADDFLREIQGLSAHFDVLRIEGEDYRHRGLPEAPEPLSDDEVRRRAAAVTGGVVDEFGPLLQHLTHVHPSRYGALVQGVSVLGLVGVRTVTDQASALRLVVSAGDSLAQRRADSLATAERQRLDSLQALRPRPDSLPALRPRPDSTDSPGVGP
jgi:cell division protein ZapE